MNLVFFPLYFKDRYAQNERPKGEPCTFSSAVVRFQPRTHCQAYFQCHPNGHGSRLVRFPYLLEVDSPLITSRGTLSELLLSFQVNYWILQKPRMPSLHAL